MRPSIRIYYFDVSYSSTCFERHIAHHQELKNYVCGCRPLTAAGNLRHVKPEAAITVLSSWWWAMCRSKHVEQ